MRMKSLVFAGLLTAAGLVQPAAAASITYDFETGAQGWTTGAFGATNIGNGTGFANSWFLGAFGLPATAWVNNAGNSGNENSYVDSPFLVADGTTVSITFDSFSNNEGGYPNTYDVEHISLSINGGGFFDVHGGFSPLHDGGDNTIRQFTFAQAVSIGDTLQFRFRYDTGDSCCGPTPIGWAFDNVIIDSVSDPTAVPEPGSLLLLGSGLALTARAWRKRQAQQ